MLYLTRMNENTSQNLTDEELQKSYWFLTHKDQIRRTVIIVLSGICLLIWAYVIFLSTTIIFIPWKSYQGIFSDLKKQYTLFPIRTLVQDIQKDDVSFVQSEEGTYDIYVRIKNPNALWRVYFDAIFSVDGTPLKPQRSFLLPDEEKYLIYGGLKRATSPATLGIEFKNISWKRISKKEKEAMSQRMRFTVKDIKIAPVQQTDGGAVSYTKVTFKILNETVYRFWEMSVPIVLKAGDKIVAINTLPLINIGSDETRIMESRWYTDLSTVTSIDVMPTVDIFDSGLYQAPTVQELEQRSPDVIKQEQQDLLQQQQDQQQQDEQQY